MIDFDFEHIEFARPDDVIRILQREAAVAPEVEAAKQKVASQAAGELAREIEARLLGWQTSLEEAQKAMGEAEKQHNAARTNLQAVKSAPIAVKAEKVGMAAGGPYDRPQTQYVNDDSKARRERQARIDHAAAVEVEAAVVVRVAETDLRKAKERVNAANRLIEALNEF